MQRGIGRLPVCGAPQTEPPHLQNDVLSSGETASAVAFTLEGEHSPTRNKSWCDPISSALGSWLFVVAKGGSEDDRPCGLRSKTTLRRRCASYLHSANDSYPKRAGRCDLR